MENEIRGLSLDIKPSISSGLKGQIHERENFNFSGLSSGAFFSLSLQFLAQFLGASKEMFTESRLNSE